MPYPNSTSELRPLLQLAELLIGINEREQVVDKLKYGEGTQA